MINVTRCVCPVSGTYAILLTKKNFNVSIMENGKHTMCSITLYIMHVHTKAPEVNLLLSSFLFHLCFI